MEPADVIALDPQTDPRWAAHRLAAVGSVASLIGHRARNRLTVVRAALEILEAGGAGDLTAEQGTAFLGELDRFLDDFNLGLEMIRCQRSAGQIVSVRRILAEALDKCAPAVRRAGIILRLEDQPGDDWLLADPLLLRQTVLNLIRNSIQAIGNSAAGSIIVRSVAGNPWGIEVQDNGPGLPPEMLAGPGEQIFAPLGAGLGLPLCRDAMTLLGGTIEYVPAPTGARFRLTLPLGVSP